MPKHRRCRSPPKAALPRLYGLFDEVAPGILPCRKAARPTRDGDHSQEAKIEDSNAATGGAEPDSTAEPEMKPVDPRAAQIAAEKARIGLAGHVQSPMTQG